MWTLTKICWSQYGIFLFPSWVRSVHYPSSLGRSVWISWIIQPYWFEDLLTPNHLEDLANLRVKISPILLAGGEHNFSHHAFGAIAKAGALDIWQPDITWCGGITAGLRIVELARVNNVPVCPHRGGEIWGLHLVVASDCLDLAETHPARMEEPSGIIWLNEPVVSAGSIMVGDQPGFGVTPREDYF